MKRFRCGQLSVYLVFEQPLVMTSLKIAWGHQEKIDARDPKEIWGMEHKAQVRKLHYLVLGLISWAQCSL